MATEPQAHAKAERRGSIGRALERLKAMMKRRHSHNKDLREHASASTPREQLTTTTTTTTTDAVQPRATDVPDVSSQSEPPPPIAENPTFEEPATSLAVDDRAAIAIDESDNDEPLLPVSPQRGGPKDERARLLLQKYGLTYDRQVRAGGAEEPPGKIRRVEKPVRIRIHWQCHECRTYFGRERSCASCGHRRCSDCIRTPPKKIERIMDSNRQLQVDELAPQSAALAAATPAEDVTYAEDAPQTSALSPGQSSRPLEAREPSETHAHDNITSYPGLTMYARPTSGERLALQPGVNPRPRRDPHSQEGELILGNEPQMVKTVQRVYKKPRQRVRYTCDRCQTIFVDAERCRSCGHDRCSDCNRDPPRKANRQPDPAVLQAVNERLAQRFPEYPVAIAAAG
ncbi:hypothetical protein BTJ68_09495 [Hortaea werneckii EXF-2000]|uniref:Uncharacterized protein n=2 Tax=Hortaea werneckii TaxID=91943 RepID=A0A3M7IMR3_HORWE|nr:hypothetical protein BTJ68_09495 [Hortaea werneckii EXF-2000]RMZ26636.1 hypothetical protein D0859_09306 [Hortaea werneckii]